MNHYDYCYLFWFPLLLLYRCCLIWRFKAFCLRRFHLFLSVVYISSLHFNNNCSEFKYPTMPSCSSSCCFNVWFLMMIVWKVLMVHMIFVRPNSNIFLNYVEQVLHNYYPMWFTHQLQHFETLLKPSRPWGQAPMWK